MNALLASVRRRIQRARCDWLCRAILETPPLRLQPGRLRIVSMLGTRDVRMYLVAIKSLYRRIGVGDIIILDDGTLDEANRRLLREHLGTPEILRLDSIHTGACPRGGCWERLLHILDSSRDSYVVQMDSDILTLGPMPEVLAAIRDNAAFTLSSGPEFGIVSLDVAAAAVANADSRETQFAAEQTLPSLPEGLGRLYVRGSAGFAGFACGGPGRDVAEAFSRAMQARLADRWSAWGTEQVASNYVVANSPGARVLPWRRYQCFYGDTLPPEAALAHFIGTWRFDKGIYPALARDVIEGLRCGVEKGRGIHGDRAI